MKRSSRSALPVFALSSISLALLSAPAQAIQFGSGDFRGSFDSSISLGAMWRTENADSDYVSPGNTGRLRGVGASVSTSDDANLNYDRGDMTSFVFKGVHDLELTYKQFGFFTRFKYWYDYALDQGEVNHGHFPNGYAAGETLNDDNFSNLSSFKGIALLDAYFFTSFNAGAVPIDLRVGRQVVSWGESTFIFGGINSANPADFGALTRPGAELKEGLLPVGMIFGSFGVTTNLNIEAFYQYEWARHEIPPCGTFFNSGDPVAEGCNALTLDTDIPDADQLTDTGSMYHTDDDEASDSGQYGLSLKYFAEELGGTEFGLYYMNYHSRLPVLTGVNGFIAAGAPRSNPGPKPQYKYAFPEDIQLFGLSFNTNLAGWSWAGELSYRPNQPLSINGVETSAALAGGAFSPWSTQLDRALEAGNYGEVQGYDEVKFTQLQFTFIKSFYNVMGAGSFTLIGEIGGSHIDGMEDDQRYGRSGTFGIGAFEPVPDTITGNPVGCNDLTSYSTKANWNAENCTNRGYITDYAWGYRVQGSWSYSNVFWGVNLTPKVFWSHDVEGVAATNFNQGSKSVGLGVKADYLQKYTMDISYSSFFGGDYNVKSDRDFIALSLGYNF